MNYDLIKNYAHECLSKADKYVIFMAVEDKFNDRYTYPADLSAYIRDVCGDFDYSDEDADAIITDLLNEELI